MLTRARIVGPLYRLLIAMFLAALFPANAASVESGDGHSPSDQPPLSLKVETIATGLDHPWSIAFLPDGRQLVTERSGSLRLLDAGAVSPPLDGVPPVYAESQGGLLDVVLHPDHADNGWLYLSYAHGTAEANATRLARARLTDEGLDELEILFTAEPLKDTPVHYGGRLAFLPDQTLVLAVGDGFDYREAAQQLDSHLGTFVRLHDDGRVPSDNPFIDSPDALPEIWTYGHRNQQAVVLDPRRDRLLAHEHGPAGGDEINSLVFGHNYGWPITTHGRDYSGAAISPYQTHAGVTDPLLHWTPSIAPSGMAILEGEAFANHAGDLVVTGLASRDLRLVEVDDEGALGRQHVLLDDEGRLRDVRLGPDGALWVLTDATDGRVLRLTVD